MTKRALIALWIGIGSIILMGLFPPWMGCAGRSRSRGLIRPQLYSL